jgi:tellurite methyltransferase
MANWNEYTSRAKGRPVRPFFTRALDECSTPGVAIDLGCGSGAETAALADAGWTVHAIDSEASAIMMTRDRVPSSAKKRVHVKMARFEDLDGALPEADLVYSFHSLPFCERADFDRVLESAFSRVKKGGVLAVTLFGPKDKWVLAGGVSGITEGKLKSLLNGFEILHFDTEDGIGPTAMEDDKHWHVFEVIARRK